MKCVNILLMQETPVRPSLLKIFAAAAAVACLFILAGFATGQITPENLRRSLALQLRHARISLEHASDVFFFPYLFRPTSLPQYQLTLSPNDLSELNRALGDWDPDVQKPLPGDRKVFTNARFRTNGYDEEVDVRYRGDSPLHWAYLKKSWLVEFPGNKPFRGMARLNLIVPQADEYVMTLVNSHRAKKLGLMHQEPFPVRLVIDGYDQGTYIAFEDATTEWVEKRGLIGNVLEFDPDTGDLSQSVFSKANLSSWGSSSMEELYSPAVLEALQELLTRADDAAFQKLAPVMFNLDSFYGWDIMTVLAQTRNQDDQAPSNNLRLFFDRSTGKFSLIPFHVGIREDEAMGPEAFHEHVPLITKRILGIPEFRQERNRRLERYLESEAAEDLGYFDSVTGELRGEFLSDFAKRSSNLEYLSRLRTLRRIMVENTERARAELSYQYPAFSGGMPAAGLNLPEEFAYWQEIAVSPESFVLSHPSFRLGASREIIIPAGMHGIETTTIIPPNTMLVIEPGARVYFGRGVSFISYSPVRAEGTRAAPITLTAVSPAAPWNTFAIIGTGEKRNVFRHVLVSYGNEFRGINGIIATGMVAFHDADADISESRFSDALGEDALNVKRGTVALSGNIFLRTSSDALDCDTCDGVISKNTFETIGTGANRHTGFGNVGGDGIDISFTDAEIRDNIIMGATDKGISIGEASKPSVLRNIIAKSTIGIAVKDSAEANIREAILVANKSGLELYLKKEIFGPAKADLSKSILWRNSRDISVDANSSLNRKEGNIIESEGGAMPNFRALLPPFVYQNLDL